RPERVRLLERARVHFLVLGLVDEGAFLPLRGNIIDFVRHHSASGRWRTLPARCSFPWLIMRRCRDARQDWPFSTLPLARSVRRSVRYWTRHARPLGPGIRLFLVNVGKAWIAGQARPRPRVSYRLGRKS